MEREKIIVEPVLSSPHIKRSPLLSGHLAKSQKFYNLNTIKVTFIKRSPLLSGCGHPSYSPQS